MKTARLISSLRRLFSWARKGCPVLCTIGGLFLLTTLAAAHESYGQRATRGAGNALGEVGQRFTQLTRSTTWTLVRRTPIQFRTHHPQGMARVGDDVFLSSVEVTEPRRPSSEGGKYEQTPGAGKAHLFRINAQGELTDAIELSEGALYHPGGIDYDGRHLWVPVAEYRPNSRSIIYRVDPETMKATVVLRADDHLGAVVYDASNELLHGVNWSARQFYTWDLSGAAAPSASDREARAPSRVVTKSSFYIAYQDCQFATEHHMLCGGLQDYRVPAGGRNEMTLGGLELVDLRATVPVWQLPLSLYAAPGVPMTRNPFYAEPNADGGLRFYFAPEDDTTTIHVYDASTD